MNRIMMAVISVTILAGQSVQAAGLTSQKERLSYAAGYQIAKNMTARSAIFDSKAFIAAIEDVLDNKKPRVSEKDMQAAIEADRTQRIEQQAKKVNDTKAKGDKFRTDFAAGKDVKKTASGILYQVIKAGTGDSPNATDTVTVQYRGTLIGGKEFDSSYKRGQPATFPLNRVIKGWQEIVQLMQPGAKFKVVIPPDLAYGDRAIGQMIAAGSTLVFEIELLSIKK
ncbi:MAG TPA: FKBP-type peptidyl-prolyl cis-trans isomerase [Gammaproteobacteria bacterium]|nr:FKBP-type peptidyl-prolyl cis-trans isomerase [Gammaproteobacteria bacterium]